MTRLPWLRANQMANSATTVFPVPVGAATSTERSSARWVMASRWNGSRAKGYSLAKASKSSSPTCFSTLRKSLARVWHKDMQGACGAGRLDGRAPAQFAIKGDIHRLGGFNRDLASLDVTDAGKVSA